MLIHDVPCITKLMTQFANKKQIFIAFYGLKLEYKKLDLVIIVDL